MTPVENSQAPAGESGIGEMLQRGIKHHRAARLSKAIALYKNVLDLDPDHPDANHLLGLAMLNRKRKADRKLIVSHLEYAVELKPDAAEFHNDLGNAYWSQGRFDAAAEAFRRALKLKPDFVGAAYNLGNARFMQDRFEESIEAYRRNVELESNWVQAHYRMANCLMYLGTCDEALAAYNEALKRKPGLSEARFGRSMALLKLGRFSEGWEDYEHRLTNSSFGYFKSSGRPHWNGEDFRDKALLVYAEQGIGDAIHFSRYIPMVQNRGGRVVLMCDPSLHAIFRASFEVNDLIDKSEAMQKLETTEFDIQIPLMSVPGIFGTTLETIPADVPYLRASRQKQALWREHVDSGQCNVGLVWAGNPTQNDDRHRSCALSDLEPLALVDGVTLYSLQVGHGSEQLAGSKDDLNVVDYTVELRDFDDTAALISVMDLVITVDTAVAHLAGALGKPVWTMLWVGHCWRYLLNREDSPWYPSMRLFRQRRIGDWAGVVEQIRVVLEKHVVQIRDDRAAGKSP